MSTPHVQKDIVLGLDIGIGSIGWALVKQTKTGSTPVLINNDPAFPAIGVRAFDIPENAKDKKLLNVGRREARMQRRVIRRRRRRMAAVRQLLITHNILEDADFALHEQTKGGIHGLPWQLRKEGLNRALTKPELAIVLIHMAKHRGFQSNSKKDKASGSSDTGKMLSAVSTLENRMQEVGAETVGAYMAELPQQRNRNNGKGEAQYSFTLLRQLLKNEATLLQQRQYALGQKCFSEQLLERYLYIAFEQRPLKSVEDMVGTCLFEESCKRAPKFAYTSEKFRLVQRLTILRTIMPNGDETPLTCEQIESVTAMLGDKKGITYKTLRKKLGLQENVRFAHLPYGAKKKNGSEEDVEARDIVTGSSTGGGEGAFNLQKIIGKNLFSKFTTQRTSSGNTLADEIARIVSVNDDVQLIKEEISALNLSKGDIDALMEGVHSGGFARFKGTMRLSLRAMEAILPHMIAQRDYAAGCEMAGYDHNMSRPVVMDAVRNPVVRKILKEVRQQVRCIIRETGIIPDRVHVELLRDMGKSADERSAIERGINRRRNEKISAKEELARLLGRTAESISEAERMRYELWQEQKGQCAYGLLHKGTFVPIDIRDLEDGKNAVQIDHILPRSRTFDNSFHNLCLCTTGANQAKRGRTPWEWCDGNATAWHEFTCWLENLRIKGLKRRNYTLKNLNAEIEGRFHARNLSDSRYATRLVLSWLEEEYERLGVDMHTEDGREIKRFRARPGQLTFLLRQAWGVNGLKYDAEGNRMGDRHHALDALIVACCSEVLLQRMTEAYQKMEAWNARYTQIPSLVEPWEGFRNDTARLLQQVFVSRAERAGTKGALHQETMRQIRQEPADDGKLQDILYVRKSVMDIKEQDLSSIKDAERNQWLVDILRDWTARGKPKDALPHSPKGDVIKKVRIREGAFTSGIRISRGGGEAQVSNGNMVRTDVYTKKGKFYLIPVYTWQVAQGIVPDRAIAANEWLPVDDSFDFCFSLTSNCYVVTENKKGEIREGYFSGTDRKTGAINLYASNDKQVKIRGIGVQNLKDFQKYRVDRMGKLHRVAKEPRP